MMSLVITGLVIAVISGALNWYELKKFFKALGILNHSINGIIDRILYIPRLIRTLWYLTPIIPDIVIMGLGGTLGLSGGPTGAIIGMGSSVILTIFIKIGLKTNKPKGGRIDYRTEMAKLR